MTLRNLLLSSALSGSLALTPLAVQAQDYDTWTLNREVLNAAANYTGLLTAAHGQVRKYITWNWRTSLSEEEQQARTEEILRQIRDYQQVEQDLVPSLNMEGVNDFDVRFRWCDNRLLSYFAGAGFKHGLSAQQIIDAPDLRARRAGRTFNGEPLGIVETVGDDLMLRTFGGRRSTPIPACMGTNYGGALAEGTVAYMTSAAEKFGVARTRRNREVRKLPCEGRQVGPGRKQQRTQSTNYNAQGDQLGAPYYDTVEADGDGYWRTKYSHCRNPATIGVRLIENCPDSSEGTATYEYFRTEAYDRTTEAFRAASEAYDPIPGTYNPAFAGTEDFAKYVWLSSDRAGNFTPEPVGHLVGYLSFCGASTPDIRVRAPVISHRTETRAGVCRAPYRRGTLTQAREVEVRRWSFADSPDVAYFPALSEVVIENEDPWAVSEDRCYRNVNQRTTETKTVACASGYSGSGVHYQRIKTVTGRDYRSAGWQDQLSTSQTRWTATSRNCQRRYTNSGSGSNRGGGGNNREEVDRSFDVDGDGRGDFASYDQARDYTRSQGGSVRQAREGCGTCNGPREGNKHDRSRSNKGGSGGGGGGGNSRVICTELWRQGLVSRELAVMDLRFTAERLTPAHYRGYHAWAIPVVHKMRQSARWTAVWKVLAVARMNEIAWQLGKADRPDYLGKIVRYTLEPLSWLIGQFVGESDIAAFERSARNQKEIPHV